MFNTLISLFSLCALLWLVCLQISQTRLTKRIEMEILQLSQLLSAFPPKPPTYQPRQRKKHKAVHVDVEYVRVTAKQRNFLVVYRELLAFLKADGCELKVKFYSTTHPRAQSLNSRLKEMGCEVIEQQVFFSPEGRASNTNTDALMVEGAIIDSPPSRFETVVLITGDHKFAECGRILALRQQKSEFIGFDSNTAQEIKNLAANNSRVSYQPLESIPDVCTRGYGYRRTRKSAS